VDPHSSLGEQERAATRTRVDKLRGQVRRKGEAVECLREE
jgi:hypothetical protein